eukprot:scaffold12564_cov60-Attheya_sp.AAC.1
MVPVAGGIVGQQSTLLLWSGKIPIGSRGANMKQESEMQCCGHHTEPEQDPKAIHGQFMLFFSFFFGWRGCGCLSRVLTKEKKEKDGTDRIGVEHENGDHVDSQGDQACYVEQLIQEGTVQTGPRVRVIRERCPQQPQSNPRQNGHISRIENAHRSC